MTEPQPVPSSASSSIARSAGAMGAATFLSRIAGLVREQAFAFWFGAGIWMDAFKVAYGIPNLLRDLFAEGAMSSAFVPTFNAVLQKDGKEGAFRLARLVLSTLLVIVGFLTVVGILLAPVIVSLLAGDFKQVPEKYDATVTMTRIMFPFLLEVSWAAVVMGMLNSFGSFFTPAIAPVFLNLAMIAAGFVLCPLAVSLGWPAIIGMAVGAMLGGFLQFLVQIPPLWKMGFRPGWSWNLADSGLRRIMNLMVPGTIGMAATQINVVVSTFLATSQGTGAVSWLGYAFRLMQLPLGLFGVAIAQATLPVVSRQAADGNLVEMKKTLAESLRLTAFINLTASLALMACAEPLIRILFEHGRFTPDDTLATAGALRAYAAGLLFFSIIKVMGPSFYALGDTAAPVRASLASVAANVLLNLALIGPFGYWGLALGASLASALNAGMLFWGMRRHLGSWSETGLFAAIWKTLVCGVISSLVMWKSLALIPAWLAAPVGGKLVRVLIDLSSLTLAGLLGGLVLFLSARLLGIPEVEKAVALIRRKLRV